MVVADELTQTFVDLLQPRRAIFEDPIERIADGCRTFLSQATLNPKWGGLVARYAWSFPTVGSAARGLLAEDLHQAARQGLIAEISPHLGTAIVVGIRSPGDAVGWRRKCPEPRRTVRRNIHPSIAGCLASPGTCRCEACDLHEIELVEARSRADQGFRPGRPRRYAMSACCTKRTCRASFTMSVDRGNADLAGSQMPRRRAGTHTPRRSLLDDLANTFLQNHFLWLWVLGFAGTTARNGPHPTES